MKLDKSIKFRISKEEYDSLEKARTIYFSDLGVEFPMSEFLRYLCRRQIRSILSDNDTITNSN